MFQLLKMLPAHILGVEGELIGILGIGAGAVVWLLVPFLDRGGAGAPRAGRWITIFGWVALGLMLLLTIIAYLPQGP
jgi:quinol-cytochrome oxidoreductase complex cytochrome b subunit